MKKKIGLILIVIIILLSFIYIYFHNNSYKKLLSDSWGLNIHNQTALDILYESERGFQNDGDRVIKIDSSKLDYELDCDKCVKDIQLEDDSILLREMLKVSKLDELISIDDLEIVDSIKKNKYKNSYFNNLIITFDENKKAYYLFESIV